MVVIIDAEQLAYLQSAILRIAVGFFFTGLTIGCAAMYYACEVAQWL